MIYYLYFDGNIKKLVKTSSIPTLGSAMIPNQDRILVSMCRYQSY
jgi:hypothetical protein